MISLDDVKLVALLNVIFQWLIDRLGVGVGGFDHAGSFQFHNHKHIHPICRSKKRWANDFMSNKTLSFSYNTDIHIFLRLFSFSLPPFAFTSPDSKRNISIKRIFLFVDFSLSFSLTQHVCIL